MLCNEVGLEKKAREKRREYMDFRFFLLSYWGRNDCMVSL